MSIRGFDPPVPPDPTLTPRDDERTPNWPAWTPFAALVAAIAAVAVLQGILVGVASAFGASTSDPPSGIQIAGNLLGDACFVGAALVFTRMTSRPTPATFGFRPTALRPAVLLVVGGYFAFLAVAGIWLALLGSDTKEDLVDDLDISRHDVLALTMLGLFACVVAPLVEELFFRGFTFTALRVRFGVWPAAVVTGLVFGGVHAAGSPWQFLLPLAFFGFVLCVVYWRSGSLYPGMALHCLNNCIAFGGMLHWDWQTALITPAALALVGLIAWTIGRQEPTATRLSTA